MIDVENGLKELVDDIRDRVKVRDKNCLIAVTGETGSGKSNAAISLGSLIDPNFSVDNIVFDAEAFLELLGSGKVRRGSVVIWDEAGVELNAREFMTVFNRVLSTVTQTFRHMNLIVIFTVPYKCFIDRATRILLHIYIETQVIFYKEEICIVKWFNLQYNPRANKDQGKLYYHYHRVKRNGRTIALEEVEIPHAPKKIWRQYEKISAEFKKSVRARALMTIRRIKGKVQIEENIEEQEFISKCSNEVIKKYTKFLGTRGGGLNAYKIRVVYNLNNKQAELVRATATIELERRGKLTQSFGPRARPKGAK